MPSDELLPNDRQAQYVQLILPSFEKMIAAGVRVQLRDGNWYIDNRQETPYNPKDAHGVGGVADAL